MREILFRGKRQIIGDWVEGYFVPDTAEMQGRNALFSSIVSFDKERLARVTATVKRETVGQFTGLTDKNGKKIFEGDIVYCIARMDSANCVVIFEEGEFRLVPVKHYKTYVTGGGFHALRCFEKEVIGNIHDNPELLEAQS